MAYYCVLGMLVWFDKQIKVSGKQIRNAYTTRDFIEFCFSSSPGSPLKHNSH